MLPRERPNLYPSTKRGELHLLQTSMDKMVSIGKKPESLAIVMLFVGALLVRLGLLLVSVDVPGDGPSRAFMAYAWSRAPVLVTHGGWLPSYLYLPGLFHFVVDDPLVSTRIFNLILGSLTIPLYYFLIRKVYDRPVALLASLLLAVFPLHIGLSVSSLTEISFLFATITSMLLLTGIGEGQGGWARLALCFLFLSWAQMTRYEAWWVTPAFALYYGLRTQSVKNGVLALAIFSLVPSAWMLGNYFHGGHPIPAFQAVRHAVYQEPHAATLVSARQLDVLEALKLLGSMTVSHLGGILTVAIVGGVLWQLVLITRSANKPEHVMYLAVVCLYWLGMVYLAMNIGASVWNRFLLFAFVMSLPLAFFPFVGPLMSHRRSLAMIVCAILVAAGISTFPRQRPLWVTLQRPTDIMNLVTWLKQSPYRHDPLLVTDMAWKATYIPLYFPEVRMEMVSPWVEDDEVYDFVKKQPPSLLITRDGEAKLQARIENIIGKPIAAHSLVHQEGAIKVYLLAAEPQ
jgi:hypothetical protein